MAPDARPARGSLRPRRLPHTHHLLQPRRVPYQREREPRHVAATPAAPALHPHALVVVVALGRRSRPAAREQVERHLVLDERVTHVHVGDP